MYTVYVLRSLKDGKRYTGYTTDLDRRLAEHKSGRTKSSCRRRPFVVEYVERFDSKAEAEGGERYIKSGKGREELKHLLNGAVPKW